LIFTKYYIPILRGLRPIQIDKDGNFINVEDTYKLRTIKDYFPKEKKEIESNIFTGLNLYNDTRRLLLGNKEGREKIKKFEVFLSNSFFQCQPITLIRDIDKDVLLIGTGNEAERHVYELGDGIQMIIVLLYPLFFNQNKNLLVFVEEPENPMHPGLQRLFLETLMKDEFRNFQFFFTTHSNHFLDITLDLNNISIYTFNKLKEETSDFSYKIENTNNDDVKVLDLIGARSSAVFLSNCTIWVEGITYRLYLKRYLEVYQQELLQRNQITITFKEDLHYSFVEYGGGNIVHWSFTNELGWEQIKATRISTKILLIADKDSSDDKPDSAKGKRLSLLKEKLGDRFLIIDGREIENTLHENVLIKTVKKMEKENRANITFDSEKIKSDSFKGQKLGKFIETNMSGLNRKYQAHSGTILPKLEFCKVAISVIENSDDLSEEALNLSKEFLLS
jgi:predicted ATP-dependent endonuclease of OLD family